MPRLTASFIKPLQWGFSFSNNLPFNYKSTTDAIFAEWRFAVEINEKGRAISDPAFAP